MAAINQSANEVWLPASDPWLLTSHWRILWFKGHDNTVANVQINKETNYPHEYFHKCTHKHIIMCLAAAEPEGILSKETQVQEH